MIKEAIIKLSKKEDLSYEMAQTVMDEIMTGEADDIQKSAYLTALAMKGETHLLLYHRQEYRLQSMETERLPVNVVRQMC